jgi:hypothetical protein
MIVEVVEAAEAGARLAAEALRGLGEHARAGTPASRRLPRRVIEQWALLWLNGVTAGDYYAYRLGRRDLAWDRKREFLGGLDAERWRERVSPHVYRFLSEDRLVLKRYLASLGLPVPRLLGVVGPAGLSDLGDETPLLSAGDVVPWMTAQRLENVVFRAVHRDGGGVLAVGRRLPGALGWESAPGGTIGAPELAAALGRIAGRGAVLVEERLAPHPAFAELAPLAPAGAQVITALEDEPRVVMASLDLATGHAMGSRGDATGLTTLVDVESGRLGRARRASDGAWFERHPETAAAIEGRTVPGWPEGVRVACRAAEAMHFTPVMAWEMTFTDRGPVISDARDNWLTMFQILPDRGLLASPLGSLLRRAGAARDWLHRRRHCPR